MKFNSRKESDMCLKTDTILLQYTFYQFQYFTTTCLCTVEIYQEMFQSRNVSVKKCFSLGGFV